MPRVITSCPSASNGRRRAVWSAGAGVFCALALSMCGVASASSPMFFASREACVASFMFNRRECANAFANADSELRRTVGGATSKADCLRRFQLCEPQDGESKGARDSLYAPVMLGVELSNSRRGWSAVPVLAVELRAGLLRPQPISHIADVPREPPSGLPTGSFSDERGPPADSETASVPAPPRAQHDEARAKAERRERLRNAPFIP
jgi:hypothetical protein